MDLGAGPWLFAQLLRVRLLEWLRRGRIGRRSQRDAEALGGQGGDSSEEWVAPPPDRGWVGRWDPLPDGRGGAEGHTSYWIRRDGEVVRAYRGRRRRPPPDTRRPSFVIRDGRAFPDDGFPTGPSSIPYLKVGTRVIGPAEGHPRHGTSSRLYRVARIATSATRGVVVAEKPRPPR